MTPNHGLSPQTIVRIREMLARFPEVEKATLFGSRAKGTYRPGSDIDLALAGHGLDWRTLGRIEDALDELLLPYNFSLIRHDAETDPDVAAHIARVGIPLYDPARA
jgi:predicted nucleotidyltransferase